MTTKAHLALYLRWWKLLVNEGVELTRQLTEAVFNSGVNPSQWEKSFIPNLYKGKGSMVTVVAAYERWTVCL